MKAEELFSAEGQELPGHRSGFVDGALDLIQIDTRSRISRQRTVQQFRTAAEDHEHVVEIVSHAAGEAPEDFHFLRLAHLRFFLLQFPGDALALADILDEADRGIYDSVFSVYGSRGNTCREPLSVALKALRLETCGHLSGESLL